MQITKFEASDGLSLLFDQVVTKETLPSPEDLTTDVGSTITTSRILMLPLVNKTPTPTTNSIPYQELALRGFHPYWLP
jgi:hypothetical protein